MSGEVEKCPILHVCPKFDVFTLMVKNLNCVKYIVFILYTFVASSVAGNAQI